MSADCDISKFLAGLKKAEAETKRRAGRGLTKAMHQIIGDAQQLAPEGGGIYSPYDPNPGELRDSATVLPVEEHGDVLSITGGFGAEHAAVQHENLDFRHDNGQAKYLETAIRADLPDVVPTVAAEIKK